MPTRITEAGPLGQAISGPPDSGGRMLIQLITPGVGTYGMYPATTLEAAAGERVFPAGTQMYLDHQGEAEKFDRAMVGRSVRDLAAVLTEDARWTGQALVAEARVFGPFAESLKQMAPDIGVSISAYAEVTPGNPPIVNRLVEAQSVDFVARAGRGGRVLEVMESARSVTEARNVGQWIESRIHSDFTVLADDMAGEGRLTREERISLSGAIGDALAAFVARLQSGAPQLYSRDIWEEPQEDVPPLGGQSTNESSREELMAEIPDTELIALRESAAREAAATAGLNTERAAREAADAQASTARAQLTAGPVVDRLLAESDLHPASFPSVKRALIAVPLKDGALDTPAFESMTSAAIDEKRAEIAALSIAEGAGRPRGMGGTAGAGVLSEADLNSKIAGAFGSPVKGA